MLNKVDINAIIIEFANQNREDLETIKAVLPYCSQQICVSFALHCALDIAHLNPDKRSKIALDAVSLWLKTGAKISQEVLDAAANAAHAAALAAASAHAALAADLAAAHAALAAANAAYAACYAAYAADLAAAHAAAHAAHAAASASASAYKNPEVYKEKMRSYLNKLKELILAEIPVDESSWLLEIAI